MLALAAPNFLEKNIKLYVTAVETLSGEKVAESLSNLAYSKRRNNESR